jgi:hypothetical protein
MNIEEFYAQDERRRRSEEIELGTEWHDAAGARYELSWVADTGELYLMSEPGVPMTEDLFGDVYRSDVPVDEISVAVVGWIADRRTLEEVLAGWEEAMAGPGSVSWITERLRARGVPARAPAS